MLDVTEIILNFQKLLVSIAKGLSTIGLFKGSDEWEELTENTFNILVTNHLAEKSGCSISHQYEAWDQRTFQKELIVRVHAGACVLVGKKDESSDVKYRYDEIPESDNPIMFSFVEFGNPTFTEKDIGGLEYAEGLDENGRVICAKKEDCKFFIDGE